MSLSLCRSIDSGRHRKRVSFTPYVEINEFQPLDSGLKSTLYYSRDEINDIQNRLRHAIAMHRKQLLMEKMEQELRASPCFQECLQRHSCGDKRTLHYEGGAALPVKKARLIWERQVLRFLMFYFLSVTSPSVYYFLVHGTIHRTTATPPNDHQLNSSF